MATVQAWPAGLIAAGSVSDSWLVRWRSLRRWLGPVVSFEARVATRVTTILRAGHAGDGFAAVSAVKLLLIAVPDERLPDVLDGLLAQPVDWPGLHVVLCDSQHDVAALAPLAERGAATATVCQFHEMDVARLLAEGQARALTLMHHYLEGSRLRLVEVEPGAKALFLAATHMLELSFPLLAASMELMRRAGFSAEAAGKLMERTLHRNTHSARAGRKGLSGHLAGGRRSAIDHHLRVMESVSPQMKQYYVESAIQALELFAVNPELRDELLELRRPPLQARAAVRG